MTSRERLQAAVRGGEVDQQPVIRWPAGSSYEGDAIVVAPWPDVIRQSLEEDRAVLAEIASPYAVVRRGRPDVSRWIDGDPAGAAEALDRATETVRSQMATALDAGADGVLYCLFGATPEHTSPMQYGGHFLERDRELLSDVAEARLNLLFVVGGEGVYLDFVSDLPAHAFGWDVEASRLPAGQVRGMRVGALFSEDPSSEILLKSDVSHLSNYLESGTLEPAV